MAGYIPKPQKRNRKEKPIPRNYDKSNERIDPIQIIAAVLVPAFLLVERNGAGAKIPH
jgi:hypothetical protein